eukprot:12904138-Prorocentrum_lima.AAC.1
MAPDDTSGEEEDAAAPRVAPLAPEYEDLAPENDGVVVGSSIAASSSQQWLGWVEYGRSGTLIGRG